MSYLKRNATLMKRNATLMLAAALVTVALWPGRALAGEDSPPQLTIIIEREVYRVGDPVRVCYELYDVTGAALVEWVSLTPDANDQQVMDARPAEGAGCAVLTFAAPLEAQCVRLRVYSGASAQIVNGAVDGGRLVAAAQTCFQLLP